MKFQNPSLNFFLKGRKDARTHKPKPICSPLFQSWGHNDVSIFYNKGQIENSNPCQYFIALSCVQKAYVEQVCISL